MKIFCRILLIFLIFFSFVSFPQDRETQYRMLTKTEINSIATSALKDSAVIYEKNKLEKQGYRYVPAYSIGGIRTTDNAKFITLGFNKGISSLSSQIVYSTKGLKKQVIFFEGTIDSSGLLTNISAYAINNDGSPGVDKTVSMKRFWRCFLQTYNMFSCMLQQLWGK